MQLYPVMHGSMLSMFHTKLKIFTACIDTSAASPSSQVRPASRHVGATGVTVQVEAWPWKTCPK